MRSSFPLWALSLPLASVLAVSVSLCGLGCVSARSGEVAKKQMSQRPATDVRELGSTVPMRWPQNLTEVRTYGEVGDLGPRIVHFGVLQQDTIERYTFFAQQRLVIWSEGKHGLIYAEINVLPKGQFSIVIAYNGHLRQISSTDGRVPIEYHPKEQPVEWPIRTPAFLSYSYFRQLKERVNSGLAKTEYDALLQGIWLGQVSEDILLMYEEGNGESSGIFVIKVTPDGGVSTQKLAAEFEPKPIRTQYDSALLELEKESDQH